MISSLKLTVFIAAILSLAACDIFKKGKQTSPATTTVDSLAKVDTLMASTDSIPTAYEVEPAPPPKPLEPLEYMQIVEKEMIDEINLLRGDPNAYIAQVDAYIQNFINDPTWDPETKREEVAAANELIRELQNMEPLPPLRPHYTLYRVAMHHGEDLQKNKVISHLGSDGSHPYQRIRDSTELDGSENLVGGGISIRESVLMLLVDAGISNRGHRKNLLNRNWEYIACRRVGTVGDMPETWIQLFGFKDPNDIPSASSVNTANPTSSGGNRRQVAAPESSEETDTPPAPTTIGDVSFMKPEEKAMLEEINLMRANPAGYVKYVDEYAAYRKSVGENSAFFTEAVEELKTQLKSVGPLSVLQAHQGLYEVARAHGEDNRKHNQLEHTGSDNSDPFDRVKRSGLKNHIDDQGYFSPNENLVGGEQTVRRSVIILLIDAGLPRRGHRRALMDPNWEYAACYRIGLIENLPELRGNENDDMDNCWVQLFAKS